MAYAGRTPTTGFRSIATKDTFSGDGSTTAFTLSLSTRTNDVEVFVENVQQEPTTAYTISGNTLTFTSAPVTGTNNIYVVYRGETISNGVHTPYADLTAGNATITGDLTVTGTTITMDSASVQTVDLGDNDKIRLGDADDAQIYHDGTNTIINNDTGNIAITGSNVGIGTSSPLGLMHGYSAAGNAYGYLESGSGAKNSLMWFRNADCASLGGYVGLMSTEDLRLWNSENTNIVFGTNNAERIRINSDGRLLLNATSLIAGATEALHIKGKGAGNQYCIFYSADHSLGLGYAARMYSSSAGALVGSITFSSGATSFNTSSDYRLKEDWVPMSDSIARVKALNPVNFAWKFDGTRVDGFLAHEAQEVVPEAVTGEKDAMTTEEYEVTPAVLDDEGNVVTEAVMGTREVPDYQGIDQSKLVPLLTGALQEAIARIETLEAEVATLKGASA